MGQEYFKRGLLSQSSTSRFAGNLELDADLVLPTSASTATAAAITLSDHGVSFITEGTSGAAKDYILPKPPAAGAVKYVFISRNTSSNELQIHTNSTADAQNFFGTTFNTITIDDSTVNPAGTPFLMFVGASTNRWAVTCGSTANFAFSASTGSTAHA